MEATRFERIVLAIDNSQAAEAASNAVKALAQTGAKVWVMHVWNMEVHWKKGKWNLEMLGEAQELVGKVVKGLQEAGVEASGEVRRGETNKVAEAIEQVAEEVDADLVVVGARGLSDLESIFQHSVSHGVLAKVRAAVLVVRDWRAADELGPRRVLLAVAGGDDVKSGVRAASAAVKAMGAELLVVHVAQVLTGMEGLTYVESEEEARATLKATVELLGEKGVRAEGMVAHALKAGKSLEEIAVEWKADVVVLGGSRMGDVSSLLLGSVTHQLMHEGKVAVLVAPKSM